MKHLYIKKQLLLVVFITSLCAFSYAQIPTYYSTNGADITKTGQALKDELSVLIINTHTTNLTYTPGVWDALKQTDLDPVNSNNVLLIYGYNDTDGNYVSDRSRNKDLNGGNAGTDWNREHTYPRSLGNPNLGSTGPGSDAHHLRASDVTLNGNRSNLPFADASGNARVISNSWYPGDEWKGDVARMMMYMYLRYGNQCLPTVVGTGPQTYSNEMMDIFLEWNAEDPVSQYEINRNVLLEGIQGNRNPFIDNPIFATTIWGGPQAEDRFNNSGNPDTEAPSAPSNLVASNTTQTTTDLTWSASTDNIDVLAYQIFEGTTQVGSTSNTTFTVNNLTPNTTYLFTIKAIDAASNVSDASNIVTITTLEDDIVNPPIGEGLLFQGFEGSVADSWNYTVTPVNCNDSGNDVWDVVSSVGSIANANSGSLFFGVRDLEGNCGTADGGTLTFDAVDISGFTEVTLSFALNVDGFDVSNGDFITYEIFHDGVSQGVVTVTVGSPYSTNGWEQITAVVPDTVTSVGLEFYIKQNGGSDYAGFDDIQLQGTEIPNDQSNLIITGVFDGPLPGGLPKGVELYVTQDIADLSTYGIGSANNGGGTDGEEFTFPAVSVTSGNYIYVTSEAAEFANFFGFAPDYTDTAVNINGDDAIELFKNGEVVDLFGDINIDGTGQPWDHLDGWAYRNSNTGPDGATFVLTNWAFSGINAFDGETTNATAASPFPSKTFAGGGGVTDTENPSVPVNLMATNTTQTETVLNWEAATDNIAVTAYQIFSGTTQIGTTTNLTFTVTDLSADTNYTFTVVAEDAAGNTSDESNSIEITTLPAVQNGNSALIITGVIDGPLSGGVPKAIELYVTQDIADLSSYGLGAANNGGGTDGEEFTFPSEPATAGSFIYVASEAPGFTSFFGFAPNYTSSQAAGINGDDAVELFHSGEVVDVFGVINVDGTGEAWDHVDGWAYRNNDTGPDGSTFVIENWFFSGTNALDGTMTNAAATTPFPIGSYTVSGPATILINELDADQSSTDSQEFIELYDGGVGNTALDGLVLVLFNGSDDASYDAIDLDGFSTNAEGYFVIGSANVPNVGMVAFTTNGIQNGADAAALYIGDAADFPNDTPIIINENLLDAVVYGTADGDDAGLLILLNPGEPQVDENPSGNGTSESIQRIPNGSGGSRNTATFAVASPTPGTENDPPVIIPTTIAILDARNSDKLGELVTVSGVLTVSDQFSGSAYLQDETAAIAIFDNLVHGEGVFQIGDSITVTGTRSLFNDQVQISPVIQVENHGVPLQSIEPQSITLSELVNHPAELVRIVSPNFQHPGNLLFGNSNYVINDSSGDGSLRIDADVSDIVGLAQPENCDEIIGVVGRFFDVYQLLPRFKTDIECAQTYVQTGDDLTIDKDKTFDLVTWNIEWFGDETNSPAAGNSNADLIQKDSVKAIIQELNADIYAVEEIADDALFIEMLNELPGYNYVLSEATSYPNDTQGTKQKIGFIYNTNTVEILDTKVLLQTIHPYYNGGDDTALTNYPVADKTRFYASGRLPFMVTANVTIDGATQEVNIVNLHARANSGTDAQERYDMRKYDVEVLKDSLDVHYTDANIIVLGDYNDDVDETVADGVNTTVSTYVSYVNDSNNYKVVSSTLSDAGFRSYVFRENMIDHIMLSNELFDNHIDGSTRVHYEFYDSDYATTTSDHFPVSTRLLLKTLTIDAIEVTDVSCNGSSDGTAIVSVSGGVAPYTYEWSFGDSTTNSISSLSGGGYSVTVTDSFGNSMDGSFAIIEPDVIEFTTSENTSIHTGYLSEYATLEVSNITGGTAPYSYLWSTGSSSATIQVSPEETTVYSVTLTDVNGCTVSKEITVEVIDVSCGNNVKNPKVLICHKGKMICVSKNAVASHLNHGDSLGACDNFTKEVFISEVDTYPNPFKNNLNVTFNTSKNADAELLIYNISGALVKKYSKSIKNGRNNYPINLSHLEHGFYYLKVSINGEVKHIQSLIKY